ncbi:DUF945 domain-containing protein [bacterium]|nr:DUF945 domain-containing protein [bacterium]
MKTGRSLSEIAAELERQQNAKRDFIADTRKIAMEIHEAEPVAGAMLRFGTNGHTERFPITEICHRQIGDRVGIPDRYYNRMLAEAPGLLTTNVNHWFEECPEMRMVRTLDGRARAFLSNRYRPLDNFDLAEVVLPILMQSGCEIVSTEITERRFYLKATTDRIQGEVAKGDVVQAGIVVSNSEVGLSSLRVQGLIYRLVCTNGMIAPDSSLRQKHIGRSGSSNEEAFELFSDEARIADDRAFWLKVRDVVRGVMTEEIFNVLIGKLRDARGQKIERDPLEVVELTARRYSLSDGERGGVLRHLIADGDLSRYGLVNAITRTSQDSESYDRATELESLGGQILELEPNQWHTLACAA